MSEEAPNDRESDVARARSALLAENIPVQIWTARPDGNLDYVTEQTAYALGLTPEQLLRDGWQNVVHAEDLAGAVERWVRALGTGETYEVEFRLKLRDGRYAWHLARAVPQRDAAGTILRWFGTNTDIEEERNRRRHVQSLFDEVVLQAAELKEKNGVLALEAEVSATLARPGALNDALDACARSLVSHLGAAFARIWTVDATGAFLDLQASAGLYTHRDGPHGRVPIGQFKIGKIALERAPHVTDRVIGDPMVGDQAWAAREGMVAFAGYPLVLGDALVGVVAAFARAPFTESGISAMGSIANALAQAIERHRAEEKLALLLVQEVRSREAVQSTLADRERLLEVAREERNKAELASRAKDEFLATASHELRTPLNSILGWARMLRGQSLDASGVLRGLETIERNARAQVQLIEDILDGSRIITGKLHLEIRPLDLTVVVQSALDAVRPAAAAKGIALDVALDPSAARIKGDPDRLQQIVWNVVNNAIKFTPKGGRVDVRLARVGTVVELSVQDNGQGIRPEFLPHLFERFRQADSSITRRHGGLGLGLALVRHLVEAHGGTVRAESEGEERGALFVVSLPVQAVFAEVAAPTKLAASAEASRPPMETKRLVGVRVLVVDDEADARDLVATVLEMQGAEVTLGASADEGVALAGARVLDVLVSDIGMPGADGYSLIRRVRALPAPAAQVAALALTAYAREEDRRRALEAGFHTYASKPVDPDELVRVVAELARSPRR